MQISTTCESCDVARAGSPRANFLALASWFKWPLYPSAMAFNLVAMVKQPGIGLSGQLS